ncbi:DUF2141 domain-containing protein [Leeuwenhoekiella marinoflava]|uniref:DUF2141 domain-containing protein n=2 Tax=Leeuwenhoekiella marinoflava TaxID=988 RepID=A0A4Q0PKL3_9FLAO|nr:DUF2141 domain-containing protein [Leeuwenhoekiella marinoflava]RXG28503.1 putative protein (DUF2141 family) [Leeuwenhoekiella marinoflava]SHF53300.1 Uncharacterized conserved protein, DUF2141 family [Leeuwenhoekiella marinoflava DSM 3653]
MKTTLLLFVTFISLISYSQEISSIKVTIENANSDDGTVGYTLYNKDNFMGMPLKVANSEIKDGKTSVVFENIASGTYAILCYHDKNGNGKMDFETNGMPKESYGSSNNIMAMGPPQWEDCKFELKDEPISLNIRF